MYEVRRATPSDAPQCVAVLSALPEYFTPDTHEALRASFAGGLTWVACDGAGAVVAFVHAVHRYPQSAEITFAAVLPALRGSGLGTLLVERTLEDLAEAGVAMVEVKTLDASSSYEPYAATRAFWERRGFIQVDMIDPLPGWDAGNPAAIYVAALRMTTP